MGYLALDASELSDVPLNWLKSDTPLPACWHPNCCGNRAIGTVDQRKENTQN